MRGCMRIPKILVGRRFYVASCARKAHSSWDSLKEARDCVARFCEGEVLISGILEVGPEGQTWHDAAALGRWPGGEG